LGFSVRCVRDNDFGLCFDPDADGVCAQNEISGCTDSTASNFNPEATEDDNSCGLLGPTQCGGQPTVTFDGYTYVLVGIGTQCWFRENLRSDNYRNGDAIPGELSDGQWSSTTFGAQAVYDHDSINLATYGRVYNWYATQDGRGLCPASFHVPSDWEWNTLENFLGGYSVAGTAMKSSPSDTPSWDGLNSSGFSGLPAGYRYFNGYFNVLGYNGYWWSSSPNGELAMYRYLNSGYSGVSHSGDNPLYGFSVRCIKD
jgi:uncharacterized protein (TIGR02145 family)